MPTETLPKADRKVSIEPATYVCTVTGDTWKRDGYEATLSNDLVHTGKSYNNSLALVPEGFRMSDSEIMAYIDQETRRLIKEGKNPREMLDDPMFARQIKGDPYRYEHTHILLKPPKGAVDFEKYVETDKQGRKYSRVDRYSGKRLVAEGALMPWGHGSKAVEINPAIGLVSVVSNGNEPNHVMHSYFNPKLTEVAVVLYGSWHHGGPGRCLDFCASWAPSGAYSYGGFRLVQGSLDDIPAISFEQFAKDRESYEKGSRNGFSDGKREGLKAGISQGRQERTEEILQAIRSMPIEEVLRKYQK